MLLAKYVTGPLKLYAGYEWIQFAPPSDPQTAKPSVYGEGDCSESSLRRTRPCRLFDQSLITK